jgi:hypothetical protein
VRERAAYKEPQSALSSKAGGPNWGYFGRTFGSPPGLPGGGITGILPVSGAGARIAGSMLDGGHNTPSDWASLSPSSPPPARPTVECSVLFVPSGDIGAQLLKSCGGGGAVCCAGVALVGGACANATAGLTSSTHERSSVGFILMQRKRAKGRAVPQNRLDKPGHDEIPG